MLFYLGTHLPAWFTRVNCALFLSHRRLRDIVKLKRATCRWALDSGGYTELALHGRWVTGHAEYADAVVRYMTGIGSMDWAAIQDWMCDPPTLARTGLTIDEHQLRTTNSYIALRSTHPDVPWAPILQGWDIGDYHRHAARYASQGVDLGAAPVVGVGSIVKQKPERAADIVESVAALGLKVHAFGLKGRGLAMVSGVAASADSMAWSYAARREPPMAGHTSHKTCANCLDYALAWRAKVVGTPPVTHRQVPMVM